MTVKFGVYFNNFPSETVNKKDFKFSCTNVCEICTLCIVVRAVYTFCTDSYSGGMY